MMARPTPSTCVTAVGKEEDSDVSPEEIDAVRMWFMKNAAKERREKRKSEKEALKQEWISDDEIARRASASSRGPVCGIQHKKSEAKYLREKAKREERLMQKENELCEKHGRSSMK